MRFYFNCPETGQLFETAAFRVIDDRGVATGADGRRRLDARVQVDEPCPWCGRKHIYRADEMICPFNEEDR